MRFDRSLRRSQQAVEISLVTIFILAIFALFLQHSIQKEFVPKVGKCLSRKKSKSDHGMVRFTQRILEFYFKPRYKGDFVFVPKSFYEVHRGCV